MAERESMRGHSSDCDPAGSEETLDLYLNLADECIRAVGKMPPRKFNIEQCGYLAHKLEVVLKSASSFLKELGSAEHPRSRSSADMARWVSIFKLLLALAKEIESFIQSCCKDAWIQAAMTLTNVSEYVSSVGFKLELCRIALCAATGSLTVDQVDDINKAEVEFVEKKASVDADSLLEKVILELNTLRGEMRDLAIFLLERMKGIKPIPASLLSSSGSGIGDGAFFGELCKRMFKCVQQTTLLGRGASANVYKAMWLGTQVAKKTFPGPQNPHFVKEVDILAGLCHPNITSMFCCAMDKRSCSIIMELMDEDLHSFMHNLMHRRCDGESDDPPFSILEAVGIMLQLGQGMKYLHDQKIVHGDLKSMNILVKSVQARESEIGYVHAKVADFGLSKTKECSTRFSSQTFNTGSTRWMPPEVINLDDLTSQVSISKDLKGPKYPFKRDVYSFGMVCYELLTGNQPFPYEPLTNVKQKVLKGERPDLPDHCPKELKALIRRCWSQVPKERPTFVDICKELKYLNFLIMRGLQAQNNASGVEELNNLLEKLSIPPEVENKVLNGPNNDLGGFLAAVDQLQHNVEFFTQNRSLKASDGALNHARNLLNKGMNRLADEFKALLTQQSKPVDSARLQEMIPNSGEHGGNPGVEGRADGSNGNSKAEPLDLPVLVSPRVVPQLREMAKGLVAAGYHTQCLKIYRDVRASTLEQSLRTLGVEKLSKQDVQKMQWEALEVKIGSWIQYMRISVKLLFAAERKLCDQIWYHLDPHREKCFADVADSSVHMLLSFGEAIARSMKSPEKLFVLLDMYETMHDLLPEIEIVFSSTSATGIRQAAQDLIHRLAQTAKDTFGDFEEAVSTDATKTPVLDGTVHLLTIYVINYVVFLFDYQKTLNHLLEDGQPQPGDIPSPLAAATMRIMSVLQTNLDGKSKLYRDPALTQLFLMNNIHYMVKSIRKSVAKDLLGDDWVQRQRRFVQQHANTYQRAAWGKALSYLSVSASSSGQLSGGSSDGSGISKSAIKERFKNFSLLLEKLYNRQTQWTIPDNELREAVRLAVAEVLFPAYRSFFMRYSSIIESDRSKGKYIRYTPEDLERMLGEFFEGKSRAEPRR